LEPHGADELSIRFGIEEEASMFIRGFIVALGAGVLFRLVFLDPAGISGGLGFVIMVVVGIIAIFLVNGWVTGSSGQAASPSPRGPESAIEVVEDERGPGSFTMREVPTPRSRRNRHR
jgi:hypothetical protein